MGKCVCVCVFVCTDLNLLLTAEVSQQLAADKTMQELLAADEESKTHTAEGAQKKGKKKKKVSPLCSAPLSIWLALAYLALHCCVFCVSGTAVQRCREQNLPSLRITGIPLMTRCYAGLVCPAGLVVGTSIECCSLQGAKHREEKHEEAEQPQHDPDQVAEVTILRTLAAFTLHLVWQTGSVTC